LLKALKQVKPFVDNNDLIRFADFEKKYWFCL
jgi:hypothetical protein